MQQANIINIVTNKYEPQQKHRLGTVSKNYLGGLNRFYGYPTKPAQEQCYWVTDRLDMTLAVDRAVKPQHKQTKISLGIRPVWSICCPHEETLGP